MRRIELRGGQVLTFRGPIVMHKLAAARSMRGSLSLGLTCVHPQTFWGLIKKRVTWKQARKGRGRRRISPERLVIDCNKLDNESFGHPRPDIMW